MEKELRTLITDPEFRDLIPPLTEEEREMLENSILQNGCETPLTIWNGVIVDGHNRYEICQRHSIPFAVFEKEFKDRDDALLWIITNQLGRRNLNSYQRGELVMKFEPLLKAQAKERQLRKPIDRESVDQNSDQQNEAGRTLKKLGKLAGVSHDTVHKVKRLTEAADEETKEKLRRGEVSINRVYTEVMRREHADEKKVCDRCGEEKPISDFNIPANRHGFSAMCRACTGEVSKQAAAPSERGSVQTQSLSSVAIHKGHPIHVAAPLPDRPDMFPNLEEHMRFVVGNFLAGAGNAIRLYTSGMASPENTETLREILVTASNAVAVFDEYVKEMSDHE